MRNKYDYAFKYNHTLSEPIPYKAKKYLSYFANGKRTSRCLYSIAGNVSKIVEDSDDANISQITLDNCHWYNNCLK